MKKKKRRTKTEEEEKTEKRRERNRRQRKNLEIGWKKISERLAKDSDSHGTTASSGSFSCGRMLAADRYEQNYTAPRHRPRSRPRPTQILS